MIQRFSGDIPAELLISRAVFHPFADSEQKTMNCAVRRLMGLTAAMEEIDQLLQRCYVSFEVFAWRIFPALVARYGQKEV